MDNAIRSFDQAHYTNDELDREILRTIREIMIADNLWELHMEGTFEEIVKRTGALYLHDVDAEDEIDVRDEINSFIRELLDITYDNLSVSLYEDGEQGMSYLYKYVDDHDMMCGCSNAYCGV